MPIYEYACDACQNRIEVQQKLSDPPLTVCSKCGNAVKKLISPPAIMFKGSGWYVTDYSDKLKPPSSSEAGDGKPKPDSKAPAAETKPAGTGGGNGSSSATPASSTASPPTGTTSGGTSSTPAPASSSNS